LIVSGALIYETTLRNNDRGSDFNFVCIKMRIKEIEGNDFFTWQDYLHAFKNISMATASRDLKVATDDEIIEKHGDKRTAKYRFKQKIILP
jgi:hypothetical protein